MSFRARARGCVDRVRLAVELEADARSLDEERHEDGASVHPEFGDISSRGNEPDALVAHREWRLPGASSAMPLAQIGQIVSLYVSRAIDSRLTNGASNGFSRPLRLRIEANPTTRPPAPRTTSAVSRADLPVVTTSSTITTASSGRIEKPRRSVIRPSLRSVNTNGMFSASA